MENNLPQKGRNNLLLYKSGRKAESTERGRISNALSGAIAYERDSSLFDTEEIQHRDQELKELLALREQDSALCIDRKNKPVYLSYAQTRTLYALAYWLGQDRQDDIREKIKNPTKRGLSVSRTLDIAAFTRFLHNGSSRKRERDTEVQNLFDLSHIRQMQIIGKGDRKFRMTAPFIHIEETLEELTKEDGLQLINVTFGSAFFYELDKRFAYIPPKLFDVWGKKGRQTELFSILLSSILSVYWHFRKAADEAEERVKKEINKTKRVSKEEYRQSIEAARKEALRYEINSATLKQRLTTDYESDRRYRAKFKADLKNAVEGLIEADLLTGYEIAKGAKGQDKIILHLSDTYNYSQKAIEQTSTIMKPKEEDENTLPPF